MFSYKFLVLALAVGALLSVTACHGDADATDADATGTDLTAVRNHDHGVEGDEHAGGSESSGEAHEEEGGIHLTRRQVDAVQMRFGLPTELEVGSAVEATGTLGLPPNAHSTVTAPADAFVRQAGEYVEGDYVRKGAVLARLENPAFVELQQTYLEAVAELAFLRQELARQAELVARDAGVERKLEEATANVAKQEARLAGLADRLRFYGIDPGAVTVADITRTIAVRAPRSGYISHIGMNDGMYVTARDELMEIIDPEHVHLELDVFESDIDRVEVGQRIAYTVPALGRDSVYAAEVHVIGREFDRDSKTVRVHGHLEGSRPPFIRDLFVEARIFDQTTTQPAVPEGAVIRDGDADYVYATNDYANGGGGGGEDAGVEFTPLRVVKSGQTDGFTSIRMIDPLPDGARLVTEGAYYVYAQSKAGTLSHDH